MKYIGFLVLLLALFPALNAIAAGDDVTFTGEASEGKTFRKEIGHGLDFVLVPSTDFSGWIIQVSSHGKPVDPECDDFVWVATPPYHFQNARYLDTEYGTTAQQAVAASPRDFKFVLNCAAYKVESHRVDLVLYGANASEKEADEARASLGASPLGEGRLWIEDSKITPGKEGENSDDLGQIHWIKFKVEIKFPISKPKRQSP